MNKYMLISVYNRTIQTETFNTLEEARAMMVSDLHELISRFENTMPSEGNGKRFACGNYWAWFDNSNMNCDWKIVKL